MVGFEAVLEAEGLLAQLARDRHELLFAAPGVRACVLSCLDSGVRAAGPNVLIDDPVRVPAWFDCHRLHAERAHRCVFVVSCGERAFVLFVLVML